MSIRARRIASALFAAALALSAPARAEERSGRDSVDAVARSLAGIAAMHPDIDRLMDTGDLPNLRAALGDIGGRFDLAARGCEDAFLEADRARKPMVQDVSWRIDQARKLFFIPWAFLSGYQYPTGKPTAAIRDAVRRGFAVLDDLLPRVQALAPTPAKAEAAQ